MHRLKLLKAWLKLSTALRCCRKSETGFSLEMKLSTILSQFCSREGKGPFERSFRAFDNSGRFLEIELFSDWDFELVSDFYFLRAVDWMAKIVLLNI